MGMNKKYSCLEFRQYETMYLEHNRGEYLEFAPRDWSEKIKRVWTINFYHPIKKNEWLLEIKSVQNTLTVLSQLHKWDPAKTVYQLVVIKDKIYINPYFDKFTNNLFYGKDCIIPDITSEPVRELMVRKIKMLGGNIINNRDKAKTDIVMMPKISSRAFNKTYFNLIENIIFKDIISVSTLNIIYSKVYAEYNH